MSKDIKAANDPRDFFKTRIVIGDTVAASGGSTRPRGGRYIGFQKGTVVGFTEKQVRIELSSIDFWTKKNKIRLAYPNDCIVQIKTA